ncbi:MAG TPA: FAD/NAD(P)-binding protein [Anaerolineae bacterium]|nr:FAD/NAD(P)-binding protein [Anaerolineae bacterium]
MTYSDNAMRPRLGTLAGVRAVAEGIKLFQVELEGEGWDYSPGQFAFLSAFGVGEAPFGLASIPARTRFPEFAVSQVGTVTAALHQMEPGAVVGVRGPLGNCFPLAEMRGKDLIVLGGGIGGAPLRPLIHTVLDNRADYGRLAILWAARSPSLLVFTDEYDGWREAPDTDLHLTVDRGDAAWQGNVGLITQLLEQVAPSPRNSLAVICGPPIMIKFVIQSLERLGFCAEQIIMTLEAKMKCGIGKCGRCNLGDKFVCLDGPVFSYSQVARFLESFV